VTEEPESDPVDAREKETREAQLSDALSEQAQAEQFAQLLQDERARDLLWRVLARCHVFSSTYDNVYGKMAYAEGQRSIGLWLLSEIANADPEALLAMQTKANRIAAQEARQERAKRARRARRD
jgi:hypothetical protein